MDEWTPLKVGDFEDATGRKRTLYLWKADGVAR